MVARPVVARIGGDKYPKPGESKIDTTGAGAIVRSRPWWGFGGGCAWWWRLLVVAFLPLGVWVVLGVWCFLLGGGLGWWWRFFLGGVGGGKGAGLGLGVDNRGGGVGVWVWLGGWWWLLG